MIDAKRRGALVALCLGAALSSRASPVHAQVGGYPARPVRLIVPFPAGASDSVARVLATQMSLSLGQPVVVENRPGAGGNLGTDAAARAQPDGHTLVMVAASFVTAPILQPRLPFDPVKNFSPIGMVASSPNVLVTHPDAPFRSLPELIAYGRANPGKLSYASAGNATLSHLLGAWLESEANLGMVHVPYKGGGPATLDVLAGRVPLFFDVLGTARANIQAGRLRALAVTSPQRTALLPEVPTVAEQGFASFVGTTWLALLAPAGTPTSVLARLTDELDKALRSPQLQRELAALGMTPSFSTPEQFNTFFRAETDKWTRIIRATGIKADE
jgi:tripartite-type tricarboxylate transporter receptor subunit TctC